MESVRSVVRRHPWGADAGLALLLALMGVPATAARAPGVAGWPIFVLIFLPLVWRRRAPLVVYWTVFLTWVVANATVDLPGSVLALPAVLYAVARYRPRRALWPVLAAVEIDLAVTWLLGHQSGATVIQANAVAATAVLLGMNLRTHRAYLAALEERARRLERERDQQARLAAAAERTRIAREMHDIVAHNLAVIVALADAAALTTMTAPRGAADKMEKVAATGREALGEMRHLLGLMREGPEAAPSVPVPEPSGPTLVPQPGFDDIDQLLDQVRAAGLPVVLTREGEPGKWGPGAGLAVYRIVQEALTNTIKHGGPGAGAHVRLRYTSAGADLEVTDDGPRRPGRARRQADGHGLAGMAERAASYGGNVEAGPLPDAGWRVRASLRFGDAA
ncbi:histidine kinase [Actinoallomurus sp. NBC_01490]|uniref:sensor histidine kinase n=1 Tax=Actinoallomurus sp. NBC_01490 TaxID=2903557 RepID=UPI002E304472|nr:histidine kinase [Actinoallomurus sp. NBC_01490]